MVTIALALVACGVAPDLAGLLERIVRFESGGEPYALHVNGGRELKRQPRGREEAVATARWLLAHGMSFDAGLGQVNSANFARLGLSAESVFDQCSNLHAAGQVLRECRQRAWERFGEGDQALAATVGCYNTGHLGRGGKSAYALAVLGTRRTGALPRSDVTKALGTAGGMGGSPPRDVFAFRPPDAFGAVGSALWTKEDAGKENER
jgi:type IV secretion system protein VirB1